MACVKRNAFSEIWASGHLQFYVCRSGGRESGWAPWRMGGRAGVRGSGRRVGERAGEQTGGDRAGEMLSN